MKNKMLSINKKLLTTAIFLFSLSLSYGQNMVVNGGFETSNPNAPATSSPANTEYEILGQAGPYTGSSVVASLTNWGFSNTVNIHHRNHFNMGNPGSPNGGDQHIDLNEFGAIWQSISGFTIGKTYKLSFYTSTHDQMGPVGGCGATDYAKMRVTVAGGVLTEDIDLTINNSAWTLREYTFVATATSHSITFSGRGSCYTEGGVLIDEVSITECEFSDCSACNPECEDEDWLDVNTGKAPTSHYDQAYRIGNAGIGTFNPVWNFKLTVDNTNGTGAPNNSRNAIRAKALHDNCTYGYGVLIETNPLGGTRALAVQGSGSDRSVLFGNGMAWFSNRVNIGGPQPLDICSDDISNPILVVNGSGIINEMSITSDRRFKEDIKPLENTYSLIERLNPVKYSYKANEFKDKNFSAKPTYGFIAQEIKEVLPNIVTKGSDGYYSVNYIAIIPVLTQAIKEQQRTIKALEEKVTALVETNKTKGSFDAESPTQKEAVNTRALLFQNNPNPFNNVTFIEYFLPQNTQSAFVKVIDNNGKLVKAFPVNETGYGQLELDCTNLQSGIYYYSLIVDKQVIDTLKMVVAKD
jgi:hypothetical protein